MEVLPAEHAFFLYQISTLGFGTGFIGIASGHPWLGSGACMCAFFARNYWVYPVYGLRRNLDILWVQFMIWSHLWNVVGTPLQNPYIGIQLLGVACFALSWLEQKKKNLWLSTYYHATVHLCTHTSLLYYYLSPK